MRIKKGLGIILVFGLLALTGWSSPRDALAQEAEQPVLKSYNVPERLANEIQGTLWHLLNFNKPGIGSARLTPDGQLLIIAPKSFHDGVEDFIAQLEKNNPAPSPSVEVNYWIVAGRKTKTQAKLDEFNRIKPALETIQISQGNMEFKLLDHVVLTSSNQGTTTQLDGAVVGINQKFSAYSDGSLVINPNIYLKMNAEGTRESGIRTNIETKSGELVVLGQSSQEFVNIPVFEPKKEGETPHVEKVNVYYIISADVKK
jgi:hypothetical protein